jgi:hypothetical protein
MLGTNASIVQETATWIVAIGTPSPWLYEPSARVRNSRSACIVVPMWRKMAVPINPLPYLEGQPVAQPGRQRRIGCHFRGGLGMRFLLAL